MTKSEELVLDMRKYELGLEAISEDHSMEDLYYMLVNELKMQLERRNLIMEDYLEVTDAIEMGVDEELTIDFLNDYTRL